MNRMSLGFALFLVCTCVLAGEPPEGLSTRGQDGNLVDANTGGTYTPPPGSGERGAIMDGIRGLIVAELRQPVIFKVEWLRVRDGYAFLKAQPRRPDGGPIDFRKTKFREAAAEGMFDGGVLALLKKTGTRWEAVDWTLGATDLPYGDWWKKYHAPKSIFDYTEP